ncbi:trypsin-like peptidase domain-containing protein [Actinoplanes sp. CA-131856]
MLTAGHVIEGASRLEVRFEAGLPSARAVIAEPLGVDPHFDLALLTFTADDRVDPAPLARLAGAGPDVEVRIAGFPRWKLRGGRFRDSAAEPGRVALLANRREGTLQITVAPPADDPDARTPWEGMSGGPVFAHDRLVAVVSRHHRREGLNRLTATPIAGWVDRLAADGPPELLAAMGLDPSGVLPAVTVASASAYKTQVLQIAPETLVGRERELAALARFCTGPDSYARWQAPPWAGKTALMASFAADPPDGVDVVSFFVTGRLAGQADSAAFTDALLDQLAALLGRELPSTPSPTTREALRRRWLEEAADHCAASGRLLVLVVDGLDEDSGTAPGSEVPSIASLLPARPGPGLKIVVAGRPHPPVPGDVPGHHPLHRCPVIELPPSPFAEDIARRALRELGQHLAHGDLRRDLAGLLAAAGGGLTLDDLIELTTLPRYAVDDVVNGLFGRTVERREDVYLFAHEVLQSLAAERLGETALDRYRTRIHAWAAGYRDHGWPLETPGYLLRGYAGLLREQRDGPRLVALSTDRARHDRMLSRLHADTAALTDLRAAQHILLAEAEPDLVALGRLAVHQDFLVHRNLNLDPEIPLLWYQLGLPDRATALAESITDPQRRSRALSRLAFQALDDKDEAFVRRMLAVLDMSARRAVIVAAAGRGSGFLRSLLGLELDLSATAPAAERARHLAGVAARLVRNGDRVHLDFLFGRLGDAETTTTLLLTVAGDCDRAEARTLADVVQPIVAGWPPSPGRKRALEILDELRRFDTARDGSKASALVVAGPVADEDLTDRLTDLFSAAYEELLTTSLHADVRPAERRLRRAEESWDAGDEAESRASLEEAVRTIPAGGASDSFFDRVARLAAAHGGLDHVAATGRALGPGVGLPLLCAGLRLTAYAEEPVNATGIVDAAAGLLDRSPAKAEDLMRAACRAGCADQVERVLRGHWSFWDDPTRAALARVFAEEGAPGQALTTLLQIGADEMRASAVDDILTIGARTGSFREALAVARDRSPASRVEALVIVARMALGADDATARDAATEAELTARSRPDPGWQAGVLRQLAGLTAAAGDPSAVTDVLDALTRMSEDPDPLFAWMAHAAAERDVRLLRLLGPLAVVAAGDSDDPGRHGELIARLARTATAEGTTAYAELLLAVAERLTAAIPGADRRDWALPDLVRAASEAGDFAMAERAIAMAGNPDRQAELQVALARSLAVAGKVRSAEAVAAVIAADGPRTDAYLEIVRALTRAGHWSQAAAAAHAIASPDARSEALLLVVQTAARAGDLSTARDLAATIPGTAWRAWAADCIEATATATVPPGPERDVTTPPQQDLVPAALLDVVRRLTRSPGTSASSRRTAAEAFVADGSLAPLVGLLHDRPDVVSAVAAETVDLMTPRS